MRRRCGQCLKVLLVVVTIYIVWVRQDPVEILPEEGKEEPTTIPIVSTTAHPVTAVPATHQPVTPLPLPSFEERLSIGKRFAFKVANYQFIRQSERERKQKNLNISLTRLGNSEWHVPKKLIQPGEDCLVYSFGVADRDAYTEQMAALGCRVFAMDPTVHHPTDWMPGVSFYPWGLTNRADTNTTTTTWSHPVYGTITGSFYSLPTIMNKLGHADASTTITALKLDCEGCEFAAFQELWESNTPTAKIRQIDVEYHFASTLGMVDENDVARMYYAHVWLKQNRCMLLRQRRHEGYQHDQDRVPKLLVDAGVSSHHCCYEMTYLCGVEK